MPSTLVSHVGIAVANLEEAIERYRVITGSEPTTVRDVADQNVRVAMFSVASRSEDGGRVELVAALSDGSPIHRFIAKRGEGLHHICLYTDDIEKRLAELKDKGYRLIDETPRIGAEGKRIAFLHPSTGGGVLIELEERS